MFFFHQRSQSQQKSAEGSASLINGDTLTRPSAAWAWGSDQLLDEYAADELRRDHDPATGAFRGVLVEGAETTINADSIDISEGSSWNGSDQIDITQAVSVVEGRSAWRCENLGGNVNRSINKDRGPLSSSRETLYAIVERVNTDDVDLGILDNDVSTWIVMASYDLQSGSSTIEASDGGQNASAFAEQLSSSGPNEGSLWRLSVSAVPANFGNAASLILYPTSRTQNTDTTIVHAIQYVESETISSLIADNAEGATRAADVLEGPFRESSGTLHFVGEHKGGDGVLWQADGGRELPGKIRFEVSGGDILFVVDDGGTNQVSLNAGALASDGTYNLAARFDGSDFAISLDGATAVTAASGTVPRVTTQRFGRDSSVTHGLNWYKTANHRSNKLTNSELEALTA